MAISTCKDIVVVILKARSALVIYVYKAQDLNAYVAVWINALGVINKIDALEVFLVKCFFNLRSCISVNTTTHVDKGGVLLQVSKVV